MKLSRRACLCSAVLSVAGCAPRSTSPTYHGTASSSAVSAAPTLSARPSSPAPSSPTSTSASPSVQLPSRAGVVEKYGTQQPSQWGLDVKGVVSRTQSQGVALTFDGCGGPQGSGFDHRIVDVLITHKIPATLFLNSRWIAANRQQFDALASASLFEFANHGTRHLPLSVTGRQAYGIAGTANAGEVYDEVAGNHELLTSLLGTPPHWFRSGTAHYDDIAVKIVRDLGEIPVSFTINADAGATATAAQVSHELHTASAGSIIIGHVNQPHAAAGAGFAETLPQLLEHGVKFVTLSTALA